MTITPEKLAEIKFKFRINPEAPRGKVAVTENKPKEFLVMARDELTDAQIMMAIVRYIVKHEIVL